MKRAATLVALALVAAGAIGCGAQSEAPSSETSPLDAVKLAAARTQEAGSSRVYFEGTTTGSGMSMSFTGKGVMDAGRQLGRLTMSMQSDQAMPALGGKTEMVIDGLVIYMRSPFLTRTLPGAKPWLKMDLRKLGKEQGLDFGALMQSSGQSDPTQALQYLRGASDDVEEIGREAVRGVETTHYRAEVTLDAIVEAAPERLRERLQSTVDALAKQLAQDTFPVEVWIDDEGLARRLTYQMTMTGPDTGSLEQSMTMELYDFGVEVDVTVPPASKTTDMAKLLETAPS